MATQLELPVSIGEGLDKLTILDIKLEKIQDNRREDCQREFDALKTILQPYLERVPWHYKILKEINLKIWTLQDETHGKELSPLEIGKIYTEVLEENDRRFRVKSKINQILGSVFKEQKGYAKKRLFFYGHLGMGDMFWLNGAVRYYSTAYDEVIVVCKRMYSTNVRQMYADDPSIVFHLIGEDSELYPFQGEVGAKAHLERMGLVVKSCGYHAANPRIYEFPYCFYDDLGLNRSIRSSYFYCATVPESESLWHRVAAVCPDYKLVHQKSSQKELPIWQKVYNQDPSKLILDINTNHYDSSHPFYTIAEEVVGKPLLFYKTLLEKASEIHLLESSLYCFATHLDLSAVKKKLCYDAFDHSNERLGIFSTATL